MMDEEAIDPVDLASAFREERVPVAEIADAGRQRFDLLYEVGRKVLSAGSLDDLNQLALSLVFDCVSAERGALLLREGAGGELVSRAARHRETGALSADELRVPSSIVEEVVSGRLGILTSDAVHDPRFEARYSIRAANIRSALCAPLWDGEEVLGVVYLDSRVQSYAFTREDLVLLNAIANLIAIRLKQEALNDQLTRERVVRANLERYHSPAVARAILARAKDPGRPEVGLEERDVTILFGDVKGFTRFAESQPPSVVADFLGGYYDVATRVMFAHGGTVMEFVGDSVMAIFGAPVPQRDHATRAVRAGLELLREVRAMREAAPRLFGPEVRVAVNSGPVVVGSVGSPDRLKYAVVGDPVNVAARLESLGEPGSVILGEATREQLDDGFRCEDLGVQQLRGRQVPVRTFCIRA